MRKRIYTISLLFLFCRTLFAIGTDVLERDWLKQAELRYVATTNSGITVMPNEDAIGAVDGIIDGKWGFHTECEQDPFWEIDLGDSVSIGRIVLFNRCDSCGERNKYLIASVSEDRENWTQIWQNDGEMFFGAVDSKPLVVDFSAQPVCGRFLRLSLKGTSYLHLDEVQVFPPNSEDNIALGKNATQSSISQWSARHLPYSTSSEIDNNKTIPATTFAKVLQSGRELAKDLQNKGVDTSNATNVFDRLETEQLAITDSDFLISATVSHSAYFELRCVIRELVFQNPLLNFDSLVFTKHAPATFPHMSDQYYCFWQRGNGAICVLKNFKSEQPELVTLTEHKKNGTYFRPDLSFNGKKVLFAYSQYDPRLSDIIDKTDKSQIAEETFFHLYEMNIETGDTRQLTFGKYDDFDGRYLPDGQIVFLSTRKGKNLQTGELDAESMRNADLPNSYVRCGGDLFRPVPVFTLHSIDQSGKTIRQISAFENFEWTPTVLEDGRIAYTRWDYIDRFNGHFFSLWATNPDGTKTSLLYGNYTVRPQVTIEPRSIPNSNKIMFVASAHHSSFGGSLLLFDRNRGTEGEEPIERITPEVVFPETEGWPEHFYSGPYPLSEDYYLVSWSDKKLPPHCRVSNEEENPSNSSGIYYLDRFGNLELIYRDPDISCMNPIPLVARPIPPDFPSEVVWDGPQEGEFLIQDVYEGLREFGFSRADKSARRLRIIATTPKVQPFMNNPNLGVSAEDTGKFVLGTVPIEDDGSAYFQVPSGIPYFFQVLDENGVAIQTMRSLTYLMPGEKATCIGCHENREQTPSTGYVPRAAFREPSRIQPDPVGTWPLKYSELIQPILNDRCISCHSPGSRSPFASQLDLTAKKSYQSLLSFGDNDLRNWAFERDRSIPGETTARNSRLLGILQNTEPLIPGHEGLLLSHEELYRFIVWMDTYAQVTGSFSSGQEQELIRFKEKYHYLLEK